MNLIKGRRGMNIGLIILLLGLGFACFSGFVLENNTLEWTGIGIEAAGLGIELYGWFTQEDKIE